MAAKNYHLYRHAKTEGDVWVFVYTYSVSSRSEACRVCLDRGWFQSFSNEQPSPEIRKPIPVRAA